MLKMEVSEVITSIYEKSFRRTKANKFGRNNLGEFHQNAVMFSIDARANHYKNGKRGHASDFIHFIMCGGVHVWCVVCDESDPFRIPIAQWENVSNHDSCWRDAVRDELSTLFFSLCRRAQSGFDEEDRVAPKDVDTNVYFSLLGRPFQFGKVTFARYRDDASYSDRFKITKLEKSNLTFGPVEKEEV